MLWSKEKLRIKHKIRGVIILFRSKASCSYEAAGFQMFLRK